MFPVSVKIEAMNIPGVLANISSDIAEAGSNIEKVSITESNPEISTLLFSLSVENRDHMARVLRRLRRNSKVIKVTRL